MKERLREVDANLLLALHALLEERNLTHAGERMTMSQPAMSGALARLRKHFDDELLVRVGRGFELSPLAERLKPAVEEAVEAAEALLGNQRDFDPTSSNRLFTVSLSEYAMTVLAEPLNRLLAEQAPGCSVALDAVGVAPDQFESQLMRRDLIIGPLGFEFPGRKQPVFTDHLVCVVASGNPRLGDGAPHPRRPPAHAARGGRVRRSGRAPSTARDRDGAARRGRPAGAGPGHVSLLTLPFAVSGTDMCAFVPARLANRCLAILDLVVVDTPLTPVQITEAAHWHPRRDTEPAVVWLRRLLYDVAVAVEDAAVG